MAVNEIRAKQVQKRVSYRKFKTLHNWLKQPRTPKEILYKIHKTIDDYYGFHSQTNSNCALESIELVLQEQNS